MRARGASAGSSRWWRTLRKAALGCRSKPSFSHSWLTEIPVGETLDSRENRFLRTSIHRDEGRLNYCIEPHEYSMRIKHIAGVNEVMRRLQDDPPPQAETLPFEFD